MVWARDGGEFDVGRRREGEKKCKRIISFPNDFHRKVAIPPVVPPVEPWVQPGLTVKMHKGGVRKTGETFFLKPKIVIHLRELFTNDVTFFQFQFCYLWEGPL